MNTLSVRLEPRWGVNIETVCKEMMEAANRLGLSFIVEFNGIDLAVNPGDDWKTIADEYRHRKNSRRNP